MSWQAQKAHRERRAAYIKHLEARNAELELLVEENARLKQALAAVQIENVHLRNELDDAAIRTHDSTPAVEAPSAGTSWSALSTPGETKPILSASAFLPSFPSIILPSRSEPYVEPLGS